MKNVLKYVVYIVIWTAACFIAWEHAIFMGFPKTREDLIEMGYTEFHFMLPYIIAVIWIAAPLVYYVVRVYLKRRSDNFFEKIEKENKRMTGEGEDSNKKREDWPN